MKQMIALDLDNTLLDSQKNISDENTRVLRALHERAGFDVVLCTGRPINAIWNYIEQLGLTGPDDYTITFNGGLVINNQTKDHLASEGLDANLVAPVYSYMKEHDLPLDVLDFDRVYELTDLADSLYSQTVKNIDFEYVDYDHLPKEDHQYAKLILAADPEKVTATKKDLPSSITDKMTVVQSQPHILEFLPKGVNKGKGLGRLLEFKGMTFSSLTAFGDADNDLAMIEAAGDGVAMGNSLDNVRAAADHLTLTNDEDGVAAYLKTKFAKLL